MQVFRADKDDEAWSAQAILVKLAHVIQR